MWASVAAAPPLSNQRLMLCRRAHRGAAQGRLPQRVQPGELGCSSSDCWLLRYQLVTLLRVQSVVHSTGPLASCLQSHIAASRPGVLQHPTYNDGVDPLHAALAGPQVHSEMAALAAAGIAYELVPGVSSALAAPLAAGEQQG